MSRKGEEEGEGGGNAKLRCDVSTNTQPHKNQSESSEDRTEEWSRIAPPQVWCIWMLFFPFMSQMNEKIRMLCSGRKTWYRWANTWMLHLSCEWTWDLLCMWKLREDGFSEWATRYMYHRSMCPTCEMTTYQMTNEIMWHAHFPTEITPFQTATSNNTTTTTTHLQVLSLIDNS